MICTNRAYALLLQGKETQAQRGFGRCPGIDNNRRVFELFANYRRANQAKASPAGSQPKVRCLEQTRCRCVASIFGQTSGSRCNTITSKNLYITPPGRLEGEWVYRRYPEDWQNYHTRYVTADVFQNAMRSRNKKMISPHLGRTYIAAGREASGENQLRISKIEVSCSGL